MDHAGTLPFRKRGIRRFLKPVGDPRDAKGLYAAMRRYIEYRGMIGSTECGLYDAERYIRDFITWAEQRSVTHPQHVTQAVLQRYQRWLYHYRKRDGNPLSIASQRAKLVPLRSFFKWLTRTGQLPANPAAEIDLPRSIRQLPKSVLTADEVEKIMSLPDITTPIGLRDRTMMEVLYATGMRRMEISNLEIGDIDIDRCVVLIRQGKFRKDRLLPLGERALYWVQEYLENARPALSWNPEEKTLFLGQEGVPMSATWLSTHIASYVNRAELGKHGGCHLFRHTMATLMLENDADIRYIQAMLGHSDLSTTQIYTQVAIRRLQQVHAKTHPGVHRHVRSDKADLDELAPQPEREIAAEALLATLDAEDDE